MKIETRVHRSQLQSSIVAAAVLIAALGSAHARERADADGLIGQKYHDQFIVKYRDGSEARLDKEAMRTSIDRAASATSRTVGKSLSLSRLRTAAGSSEIIRSSRQLDVVEAAALMRQIATDPSVEYVEPDRIVRALAVPNDTSYSTQWHLSDATGGIRAPGAWDSSTGDATTIAIIDTGITSHSDLDSKRVGGYDFITDPVVAKDGNGRDADPSDPGTYRIYVGTEPCNSDYPCNDLGAIYSDWHGTAVAGIAAAATGNASGIAGVGYNTKFLPLRVLGRGGTGVLSDVSDAIVWASGGMVPGVPANAYPAKVINLSLGFQTSSPTGCSTTLQNAINTAINNGATVIAAAGNDNYVSYFEPAKCAGVIAVAATNRAGSRASYSSYGALIDIAAPGGDGTVNSGLVYSTSNTGTDQPVAESFAYGAGTSMAAPQVAGVVALMQAMALPTCSRLRTPAEIEQILKSTARPFPIAQDPNKPIGSGILDASAAVGGAKCHIMVP